MVLYPLLQPSRSNFPRTRLNQDDTSGDVPNDPRSIRTPTKEIRAEARPHRIGDRRALLLREPAPRTNSMSASNGIAGTVRSHALWIRNTSQRIMTWPTVTRRRYSSLHA